MNIKHKRLISTLRILADKGFDILQDDILMLAKNKVNAAHMGIPAPDIAASVAASIGGSSQRKPTYDEIVKARR